VRLDRRGIDPQLVDRVAPARRAGHRLAAEQAGHRVERLAQPVQALAEARSEIQAEGRVLELEPRTPEAQDRPPATDVVNRRDRLGYESRVAERVGADEQSERDAFGRLRDGSECRVTLEDRLVGVAEDGEEVIPGPERVEPERLGALRGGQERGPVAGLAPQVGTQFDVRHSALPSIVRKRLYALDFFV
jgi:hypothetical protein